VQAWEPDGPARQEFEAGKAEVSRGRGIVSDPAIHERVRAEIDNALREAGCDVVGWMDSPILGGSFQNRGNKEFLVYARTLHRETVDDR
jgi:23S rRNA (cytidine1920-2'-O)/16S rRNA (cytidine1409-2'-O)-methyltransferase